MNKAKPSKSHRLKTERVIHGWSVRIRRTPPSLGNFVAYENPPLRRAFFLTRNEARDYVTRWHEISKPRRSAYPVKAVLILKVEG